MLQSFASSSLKKLGQTVKSSYTTALLYSMGRLSDNAKLIWRSADAVCFDVDSTVCTDEAIDELAKFVGREKEVADLTQKAMRGGMSFKEALAMRLDIIQPSVFVMRRYLETQSPSLTPGIRELISTLQKNNVSVYLVSGGFDTIIQPVAEDLGIPLNHVFANRIKYYFNGDYAGFDETQPTCEQDGKAQVAAYLKHRHGYQRLVMIGDGATDLVASPPADLFIGFGGNQIRERVKKEAKWFVTSFDELRKELQNQ
ncbi:phosphoserine phosphatase isoform X2 [Parasteatoda tepidariorum]|uniref:phosphoserine phosphatase isoform X3 n=1 Tax=Parasteatoda tepidariorum TaxID=114398 RepID=UPI000A2C03C3|nr:phosphoserine phosphatase isoform X3 [Parasteatoda tepidariorum]XP_042911785.1 phosphoserine phosphatase isoform X4 [Parasteatoda tepidariorum]